MRLSGNDRIQCAGAHRGSEQASASKVSAPKRRQVMLFRLNVTMLEPGGSTIP
jgi:hypothetical protein